MEVGALDRCPRAVGERVTPGLVARRRLMVSIVVGACVVVLLLLVCTSVAIAGPETIIAWVPSHQDDTGSNGWHEYQVCGDIVQRTMALLTDFTNVLCWETGMGLTSDNVPAMQSEIDQATAAHAQIFISIHVNGDTPSGLSGTYEEGDTSSDHYVAALLHSMVSTTGMTDRGFRARSDLYVLNPANNPIPIRVLLELGDCVADRALLMSEDGRQKLAAALAKAVRENTPPPGRYEQGDSRITYTGSWVTFKTSGASAGSYKYADSKATATICFDGTRLDWIATTGLTMGLATVSLDGAAPIQIDLHSSSTLRQQKVWSTGTIGSGSHKLIITWTGKPSVAGGGTRVNIDALDVVGTLTQAPGSSPPPATLARFEQTSTYISCTGTWVTFKTSGASAGSYKYADSKATATICFDGTRLDWIATTGLTMGLATVSLDGAAPIQIDLHSSSTLRQQKVWSTGTIGSGSHKLVITWTGKPSVAGGGTRVNIDALDVLGTLTQATS